MEGTSYGFRLGRSAHDSIARIYTSIRLSNYFVLDAEVNFERQLRTSARVGELR
ncbi:hypothetical protein MICAK_2780028 [Microcystis aeruginosa PCC 9701]|uniref:Uncharacterized protein n=1 Tax=Microcystis aeruginosa PCC 9701 TaxID=721123 RepID=I4IRH9_MICAE|nr:hypothetical protein MICAK_2780028 [Microcystis aeruginosa PCC 9701]